tara:strand:- start:26 stop:334 length:309 start_codon:yes stop_codon:yes gene_type:complete
MAKNRPNNLKSFFIKLISISIAVIIIINVIFNLVLSERIEKVDKILSIFEMNERKNLKNKVLSELDKNLDKENLIEQEDKIIIYKAYKKILKEFEDLKQEEK